MFEFAYLRLRNKFDRKYVWDRYARNCQSYGLKKSALILSFDCDTHADAEVVEAVHDELRSMGIKSSFAVPGEILRQNHKVYKSLADRGCEFLNHGEKEHTVFNRTTQCYESTFFYHELSDGEVVKDLVEGHNTLVELLGLLPTGWRTPHFGTYQKRANFDVLYEQLRRMNYGYSTSRMPTYAFQKGPVVFQKKFGLFEIPVTGTTEYPFTILDSWRYFASPKRDRTPADYLRECNNIAVLAEKRPILINIYADPSHVAGRHEFMEGMREISKHAESCYFKEIV